VEKCCAGPAELSSADFPIAHRALGAFSPVEPLLKPSEQRKLHEVEDWIAQDRPIQFPPSDGSSIVDVDEGIVTRRPPANSNTVSALP